MIKIFLFNIRMSIAQLGLNLWVSLAGDYVSDDTLKAFVHFMEVYEEKP